jgi:hypothetical protein
MNPHHEEEALDAMLNAADPYLDDAGFTARVMERLPSRRSSLAWVRVAILLGASVLAALVLILNRSLCIELSRAFARLTHPSAILLSPLPLASVVMLVMLLWAGLTAVARE